MKAIYCGNDCVLICSDSSSVLVFGPSGPLAIVSVQPGIAGTAGGLVGPPWRWVPDPNPGFGVSRDSVG